MPEPFHHFSEHQCAILRDALKARHPLLIDDLWGASTLGQYYDKLSELDALVDAYSHLWASRNTMMSVHDDAHVLREQNRINAAEKLLALVPDLNG